MTDGLKTTATGIGGLYVCLMQWLPDVVSVLVGLATLTYLLIKISNEIKEKK